MKSLYHNLRFAILIAIVGAGCAHPAALQPTPTANEFGPYFPQRKHLHATEIYALTHPPKGGEDFTAMRNAIGSLLTLDVVVKIERQVPVVEILLAKDSAATKTHHLDYPISAHLLSLGSEASELKQDKTYRIEGLIVDAGFFYGAYVIYLYRAQPIP